MAPGRGKGGARGKANDQLKLGDLVLAKVKGFPAWPAKISNPEDWGHSPDPKKKFVQFFGTSEMREGWLHRERKMAIAVTPRVVVPRPAARPSVVKMSGRRSSPPALHAVATRWPALKGPTPLGGDACWKGLWESQFDERPVERRDDATFAARISIFWTLLIFYMKDKIQNMQIERGELLKLKEDLENARSSLEDKKKEIDNLGAQKMELIAEADKLKVEKDSLEILRELIDEKREELRKEAERVAEERKAVEQYVKTEHDSVKLEKEKLHNQFKSDVESLAREREEFLSKMEHEHSDWFSKIQQEREAFVRENMIQKKELENCTNKRREEIETYLKEKEEAFEQEKASELQHINSQKELIVKELEHVAFEMKKLKDEQRNIVVAQNSTLLAAEHARRNEDAKALNDVAILAQNSSRELNLTKDNSNGGSDGKMSLQSPQKTSSISEEHREKLILGGDAFSNPCCSTSLHGLVGMDTEGSTQRIGDSGNVDIESENSSVSEAPNKQKVSRKTSSTSLHGLVGMDTDGSTQRIGDSGNVDIESENWSVSEAPNKQKVSLKTSSTSLHGLVGMDTEGSTLRIGDSGNVDIESENRSVSEAPNKQKVSLKTNTDVDVACGIDDPGTTTTRSWVRKCAKRISLSKGKKKLSNSIHCLCGKRSFESRKKLPG